MSHKDKQTCIMQKKSSHAIVSHVAINHVKQIYTSTHEQIYIRKHEEIYIGTHEQIYTSMGRYIQVHRNQYTTRHKQYKYRIINMSNSHIP